MEENTTTLEKFIKVEDIGEGMFAKVCKIENIETREVFAAKILNAPIDSASNDFLIFLSREVNYISGMNHPPILKFIGYSPANFEGLPNPVIITEFCKNGSLMKFIENSN